MGDEEPGTDAEVLQAALDTAKQLGTTDVKLLRYGVHVGKGELVLVFRSEVSLEGAVTATVGGVTGKGETAGAALEDCARVADEQQERLQNVADRARIARVIMMDVK